MCSQNRGNQVRFQRLESALDLELPSYESPQAAGMDLRAALSEPVSLAPGESTLVPTGFRMALPEGYEAQIRPRSGFAWRHGITMLNAPGTIDADYRGEGMDLVLKHGAEPFVFRYVVWIIYMLIGSY